MLDPLVLDLGVNLVAVDVGITVDLVEDDDDRLLGLPQLAQGFDFPPLHVARDDEEDQSRHGGRRRWPGSRGPRRRLRRFRACRRQSRRAPSRPGRSGDVMLPPLSGSGDRRTVSGTDLKDILAEQGIEHRRLAPANHAEGGDLDRGLVELLGEVAQLFELAGEGGLFLGGQLEACQGGFETLAARSTATSCSVDGRLQLVEQFGQLFIGHGRCLSRVFIALRVMNARHAVRDDYVDRAIWSALRRP